jgi:MoaA/NifB/PqqE/SkfB family radical SAM enzyme
MLKHSLNYVLKDPDKNLPGLLDKIERFDLTGAYKNTIEKTRHIIKDDKNNWNLLIRNALHDLHPNVIQKILLNFVVNASLIGGKITEKNRKKHHCAVPWAVLMDPTAACNLSCTGCWASEYDRGSSLSLETMDRIINEGKKLGIYFYLYSGGEPLMRKDDLIRLAEKHHDCMFLAFTNATLMDEAFAKDMQRVGNLALAVSIEGFETETDMRRGRGTYKKIMKAMDILKEHGLAFGYSTCYHSKNTEVVGSEEYVDLMIDKGCKFGWYFTYMPLGKRAVPDLLATPEQRKFMYYQVRKFRETKPVFVLDFWNDGEYVNGCIAGGRHYLHINAGGDVEPCAFIHYSNVNIRDVSLLESLKSPLFMQYKENIPFNKNHLRPCPLLDNPDRLKTMVIKSGAHSTQPMDGEPVEKLTEKCREISQKWADTADRLWEEAKAANSQKT